MSIFRTTSAVAVVLLLSAISPTVANDRVTVGLSSPALAEHGGFYQAVADGTYARYGLDVVLREAAPDEDNVELLLVGALDFSVAGTMLGQVEQAVAGVPTVTVGAIFQKETFVLLAHSDVRGLDALDGRRLRLSAEGRRSLWPWLAKAHGVAAHPLTDVGPELATFLADPGCVIDGWLASTQRAIEIDGGFRPAVLTMAEASYRPYSGLIQTTWPMVTERRELVQRFVDATILGWYTYLYGDPAPAHALIRSRNRDLGEARLTEARQFLIDHGLVDSGHALMVGIGGMDGGRWADLMHLGHRRGFYPFAKRADFLARMYTLDFVNQEVGMELKQRLLDRPVRSVAAPG